MLTSSASLVSVGDGMSLGVDVDAILGFVAGLVSENKAIWEVLGGKIAVRSDGRYE